MIILLLQIGIIMFMFRRLLIIITLAVLFLAPQGVQAQQRETPLLEILEELSATDGAEATLSGEATPSGIVERVVERRPDITEPAGEAKGRLERLLEEHPVGPLSLTNFLQHAIRNAVRQGVPANTIVLVLLFPVVAAVVAAGRHLIGLRGFGIFVPAVLSVAFVATGIIAGIFLFLIILAMATLSRRLFKKLKLQYLPRMALLLWLVSLGVMGSLFLAPYLNLEALITLNIFPILILILLAENFIEVQLGRSRREATELTFETLILALITSLLLSLDTIQRFALLNPELLVISVAIFDIFVGRYVGLRYWEYVKFRKLVK
jgi:hypothetical protein